MLQSVEYEPIEYLKWYFRTSDFSKVIKRRDLVFSRPARMLLLALRLGLIAFILIAFFMIYLGRSQRILGGVYYGLATILIMPVALAVLVVIPLFLGKWLLVGPKNRKLIKKSEQIFAKHKAVKIAVAGSYGKTTMKEMLATVLSEGKNVAATPANKNVAISHVIFANKLTGKEDILIIEYGEGAPKDVQKFAQTTHPTHGIITGLAPAHLDRYKTIHAAGEDIFELADYLEDKNIFVNSESQSQQEFIKLSHNKYDSKKVMGWTITGIKIEPHQTSFVMKKGKDTMNLSSGLLGKHQVGPLALVAALARDLGLTKKQVESGVAKTVPFEHRMEPRNMGGTWIIDDTYNGNIEGIRAGLELLKTVNGKQKIYVTPGLVDQGKMTKSVHIEMGELIAKSNPSKVVLMSNSVTEYIQKGMKDGGYEGETEIVTDPLFFYTNLTHFIATGDIVLMQNDWTDNYA